MPGIVRHIRCTMYIFQPEFNALVGHPAYIGRSIPAAEPVAGVSGKWVCSRRLGWDIRIRKWAGIACRRQYQVAARVFHPSATNAPGPFMPGKPYPVISHYAGKVL